MTGRPTQRGRTWLRDATPVQVRDAFLAGELADVIDGRDPDEPERGTPEWIETAALEDVRTWRDQVRGNGSGEADQGARGSVQTTRARLRAMSPEEVRELHATGALDGLLRGDET